MGDATDLDFPGYLSNTCEPGHLAFDLLPILLSRLEALGGSEVQEIANFLRYHPPSVHWIEDGRLEPEKVKAGQCAIEEFLKVRFKLSFALFEFMILNLVERNRCIHGFTQPLWSFPLASPPVVTTKEHHNKSSFLTLDLKR
jgi:hypothetical protein